MWKWGTIFERLLSFTIILGIPSKILGAVIGVLQHYITIFIVLYLLNLPFFNIAIIKESKYNDMILSNTPVLSTLVGDTLDVIYEFADLKDKYEVIDDPNQFNLETLDLFLKHKVITILGIKLKIQKNCAN